MNEKTVECGYDPVAKSEVLIEKLSGEPLPVDSDFGGYFPISAAEIRHNYTNYDELLLELNCGLFVAEGGKCGWDYKEHGNECELKQKAYWIFKEAANELAKDLIEDWKERRLSSHDSTHEPI